MSMFYCALCPERNMFTFLVTILGQFDKNFFQ